MNRCESMRDELKAYLDGQLPFMLRQQVRRHLKRCVACREELSTMEQTGNQLKSDAPTPLEASLRTKILAAAGSLGPKPGNRPQAPSKWRRKPLMVWAVAATALTAWCITYPLTHFAQSPGFSVVGKRAVTAESSTKQQLAYNFVSGGSAAPVAASQSAPSTPMMGDGSRMPGGPGGMMGQKMMGGMPGGGGQAADAPTEGQTVTRQTILQNQNRVGFPPASSMPSIQPQAESGKSMNDVAAGAPSSPDSVRVNLEPSRPEYKDMMKMRKAAGRPGTVADYQSGVKYAFAQIHSPHRAVASGSAIQDADEVERTVHKEAQITVAVENVEAKSEAVEQIVQGVGGYVADNNLNTGDDGLKTASLTLKVPVAQFQSVLNQVARQGEVKAKSLSGQDLTEEISDQKQSEHTLREDIQTTQQQLAQRLSRMGREERMDTLRELRTQVAQKQARLKLLHKLGALSTITVELDEKARPVPVKPQTSGFMNDMNETLHGAVQSMMQAARLPILTFIWIIAYAPLWILLVLGYRWAVRR